MARFEVCRASFPRHSGTARSFSLITPRNTRHRKEERKLGWALLREEILSVISMLSHRVSRRATIHRGDKQSNGGSSRGLQAKSDMRMRGCISRLQREIPIKLTLLFYFRVESVLCTYIPVLQVWL